MPMLRRTRAPAPSLCSTARKALRIGRGDVMFGDVLKNFVGGKLPLMIVAGFVLSVVDASLVSLFKVAVMESLYAIARRTVMSDTKRNFFMKRNRHERVI